MENGDMEKRIDNIKGSLLARFDEKAASIEKDIHEHNVRWPGELADNRDNLLKELDARIDLLKMIPGNFLDIDLVETKDINVKWDKTNVYLNVSGESQQMAMELPKGKWKAILLLKKV